MTVLGTGWQHGAEEHGEELVLLGLTQALHKLLTMLREPPLKLHLAALTRFVITLASNFA